LNLEIFIREVSGFFTDFYQKFVDATDKVFGGVLVRLSKELDTLDVSLSPGSREYDIPKLLLSS